MTDSPEKIGELPVDAIAPAILQARLAANQEFSGQAAQSKAAGRHNVVFRKKFTLPTLPREAYAALLATQNFAIQINGRPAESTARDGFRNGRIAIFDLKPLLVAGENIVAIRR